MRSWEEIAASVSAGERLTAEDALTLWQDAPLWRLGELAVAKKREVSGDKVFYNRNFHLEPTNVCLFNCKFCSFRRPRGSEGAWEWTMDEMEEQVRRYIGSGVTEVHIVGGVHPDHNLDYYCELIRRVKTILPNVAVKAYTAIELSYMIRKAGLSTREGLQRLIDAGMDYVLRRELPTKGGILTAEMIEREGFSNLADALRAKATSLLIDGSGNVIIRGVNSIGNPAPALIVCDGMEIGSINAININDVASVEVQRDGTLYGFRGVGGVIVIKTKSGAKR